MVTNAMQLVNKYKSTLSTLVKYKENDIECGIRDLKKKDKYSKVFSEMIIAITSLVMDIRYCNRKGCACSPESKIRILFQKYNYIFKETLYEEDFKSLSVKVEELTNLD